jgi:hypothetical protein
MKNKPNVVGILIPARDFVNTGFAYDLARTVGFHVATTPDRVVLYTSSGTLLSSQRQDLARDAIASGCTHTLWLDSDMRFPKDVISRLLAHDEGIVAANYAKRRMPTEPISAKLRTDDMEESKVYRVYTEEDSTGLEEVDYTGMGVMLVKREVYEKMEEPWFAIPWNTTVKDFLGEDVFFCRRARENGFKTYIDHDLSKQVYHIGSFEFKHEHTWACREASNGDD